MYVTICFKHIIMGDDRNLNIDIACQQNKNKKKGPKEYEKIKYMFISCCIAEYNTYAFSRCLRS